MEADFDAQQVVLRVARCSDRLDIDELVAQFTEDAVLETPGGKVVGRPALSEYFGGAKSGGREDRERTKHVVTNALVSADGDDVVVTSYFQVLRSWGLAAWGRYEDHIRKTDGGWRIAHRRISADGHVPRPGSS